MIFSLLPTLPFNISLWFYFQENSKDRLLIRNVHIENEKKASIGLRHLSLV